MHLTFESVRARKARDVAEAGWTLVELMVAMGVASIALVLVVPVITSVNVVVNSGASSSNATAVARNGLRQLTADIGSTNANNVCIPSSPTTMGVCPAGGIASGTGSTLRVLTNVNNVCTWVQWSLSGNALSQQTWPSTSVSGTVTATGVPIVGGLANTASQPVFTLTSSVNSVDVQLVVRGSMRDSNSVSSTANTSAGTGSQTVSLQTTVNVLPSSPITPSGAC
jgi:type II secretory pathway pseudopilin PulG